MAKLNVFAVLSSFFTTIGVTPQTSCNRLATFLSVVVAKIGVGGLNLLTFRAVEPDFVRGIIAPASSCLAILLTAELIALGIVLGR